MSPAPAGSLSDLRFEGKEPIELRPGAFVRMPAHHQHRVEWTDPIEPTIWLAIPYGEGSSCHGWFRQSGWYHRAVVESGIHRHAR